MRYAASGPLPGWTKASDSRLTAVLQGADVAVEFSATSTRVVVTVENTSGHAVEVRMGAEGTPRNVQIGELLQRPIESAPGVVGSDYRPYATWMPWSVPTASRATFHLDTPLGRAPSYGQFFVFTVEARRPTGPIERRSIQVNARHVDADARR
ncbi:MAG: hypothetical protein NXI31_01200 [bacterium]|nr:hypothetical protein [bacterium]